MLSKEVNERLTRVGPGTPMGNLLRRYWFPIAGLAELDENSVKKVRLLCEDLVLYRDRSGNLGLIDEPCPHRRVSMEYGIPEERGLRCPYHGWLFDETGRCTEQPAEPWNSTFKDRVTTKAYPVEALGGLVFAYLGPKPVPLLPRYDLFVWDNVIRQVGFTLIPCNWLQIMENSLDPTHAEWLHAYYMNYVWSRRGVDTTLDFRFRNHVKIGFDRFDHGIIKRRIAEGYSEADEPWHIGHPIVFPYILRLPKSFQIRVPVDDTHTLHMAYGVYRPGIPVPPQTSVPVYDIPLFEADGSFAIDFSLGQDMMAWVTQRPIAERDLEVLGVSDIGIIMYRQLLLEQLERVERGEEPMEVYRDPAANTCIQLPAETGVSSGPSSVKNPAGAVMMMERTRLNTFEDKFGPLTDHAVGLFREAAGRMAQGEPMITAPPAPVYPVGYMEHRAAELRPG